MDYADPANRRLRDEPTLPLSPDEAKIAAKLYQDNVLAYLLSSISPTSTTTTNHEKETQDPRHN